MTALEKEAYDVLLEVRECMGKKITAARFVDLMTGVRNYILHYENTQYGCMTGKHATKCSCKRLEV